MDGSSDPFFRYKTRQLQLRYLGRDKMLKTFFVNLSEMSEDIKMQEEYINAYLGYSFSSKYGFDKTQGMYYVAGKMLVEDVSLAVEEMFTSVILCNKCGLPELRVKTELNDLWGTCDACGMKYRLVVNDKFYKFIRRDRNKNKKNKKNKT
jgi:hypothetical protein